MSVETAPIKIKVHFDGKVFVPDTPVDLPIGMALEVTPVEVPNQGAEQGVPFVRRPGSAKREGSYFFMSDDFDEPLEDFKDYM